MLSDFTDCHRWFYWMLGAYCIAGKIREFGESSMIRQTKPSKLVLIINNLLADLLIHWTFSPNAQKESIRQTFPIDGTLLKIICMIVFWISCIYVCLFKTFRYIHFHDFILVNTAKSLSNESIQYSWLSYIM